MSDPVDHIPEDRRERARTALAAAFGRSPVTSLEPITAGASASSYRIELAGRSYLLRLESPKRDAVRNPHRSYPCMRAAAAAGLTPAVHHADAGAGVVIADFVQERALADYPGGTAGVVRDLGSLVARLQEVPAFPPVFDYPSMIGHLFGQLLESGLFVPGLLDRHREGFERIRSAYPWDATALVSSHNELNPSNLLFDGERLWLIDWETAFRNDPLVDVATLTMFHAATPELEGLLLRSWLGRAPDQVLLARLRLIRMMVRLFYGCAASLNALGSTEAAVPATDFDAPTPAQFRDDVAQGRMNAGAPKAQRIVGKIALTGFLAGLAAPEFEEALVTVRRG